MLCVQRAFPPSRKTDQITECLISYTAIAALIELSEGVALLAWKCLALL